MELTFNTWNWNRTPEDEPEITRDLENIFGRFFPRPEVKWVGDGQVIMKGMKAISSGPGGYNVELPVELSDGQLIELSQALEDYCQIGGIITFVESF